MSSWSSAAPSTYPRSSRSRSPRRMYSDPGPPPPAAVGSGYPPPPPASYYPPEPHDYHYDHRKAWDEYYDRRDRARSRSPLGAGEAVTRKRRRSTSTDERDRFTPRPRYSDEHDAHSRAHEYPSPRMRHAYPSPHMGHHPPPPGIGRYSRPPPDPYTMEPQPASLRQFADWFRYHYPKEAREDDEADRAAEKEAGRKTRDGIRSRWEKYKKEHTANQIQTLFDHHKRSPWFSEKYNPAPEWENLRSRVRKQAWKGRPEQFVKDLEQGKYDPKSEVDSPVKEVLDAILSAGDEAAAKSTENTAVAMADNAEQDAHENGAASPTKSETNGKPTGHGRPLREEDVVFVEPEGNQMTIKTIPPDIGRQKIEEACASVPGFIHLALGDPLQKRHYYRAGWMKFEDDTDMSKALTQVGEKKIEGFKLHVTHITRPYQARLRHAPEVASSPQRIEKDLQQIKQLAAVLEEEYAALRLFRDGAPEPKIEDKRSNGKESAQGDVLMTDGTASALNGAAAAGDSEQTESQVEPELEPLEKGSEAVERRIEKLVADLQAQQQDITEGDGTDSALETKKSTIALDLYLAYLRAAFNTCYYCAAVCDHVEELNRKCPKHVRKPWVEKNGPPSAAAATAEETREDEEGEKDKPKDTKERTERRWERNDERWAEWVDSKLALLINRAGIEPTEYGGKNYEEELRRAVEPYIKQEDEGKFRCKTCNKLFKAVPFLEKHIANKHPELVKQLEDLPFFNNFALDPHRIQPFSHLPPPMGNSGAPPPQAYGLQGTAGGGYGLPDYGRPPPPMQGGYGGGYPPPSAYPYGGHGSVMYYDYAAPPPPHWQLPFRRDDPPPPGGGRRLQERVGGYAQATSSLPLSGVEGLPPKPVASLEPGPGGGGRRGSRSASGANTAGATGGGPPPPPPPDAKEDPRATSGKKVSYHDMDDVAEGDVELTY